MPTWVRCTEGVVFSAACAVAFEMVLFTPRGAVDLAVVFRGVGVEVDLAVVGVAGGVEVDLAVVGAVVGVDLAVVGDGVETGSIDEVPLVLLPSLRAISARMRCWDLLPEPPRRAEGLHMWYAFIQLQFVGGR